MIFTDISKYVGRSFDNLPGGASAKKLTAFLIAVCYVYAHFRFVDLSNVVEVLVVDGSVITALLGVSTIEAIRKKKDEPKSEAL